MKITILGCGSSAGVPLIGNDWGACDPSEPRNERRRSAILVEEGETTLLVDTPPDLRSQLIDCGLKKLTAVLYTHAHADHTHGIDDLRAVNWMVGAPLPVYGSAETLDELRARFPYVFPDPSRPCGPLAKPKLVDHIIDGPLRFGSIDVQSWTQKHGPSSSLGFRFNDFAYTTDVSALDDTAFAKLAGVKVWVVVAVRREPHPSHAHLAQTLEWIARVKPERAYLTHMDQSMDYATLRASLPPHVWPAHDGLVIDL